VSSPPRVLAIAGTVDGQGRPLTGAAREVDWLRGRFAAVTSIGDTATPGPLIQHDLVGYDLLHVAAHADVDVQRPWNSALVLGPADRPVRLRAGTVADLDLQARLAVLSSCNSAAGAVLSGEGMLGIATGFLSAGVPAVVATLWPVDDRQAELFSRRFYGELAEGRTAAQAIQRARAWLRARSATAHPFHWAGYVLMGDGSQVVPLEERTGLAGRVALGGTLAAALASVLAARRRRQRTSVKG
jgi:CHAT domain-containing protein